MDQQTDIEKLKEAVRIAPQDSEAWKALAACLAESGQRRKALEAYRHSLELTGGDERVLSVMKFLELIPVVQDEGENRPEELNTSIGLLPGVTLPLWFQVFLGLFSFLIMLLAAVAQEWSATDMVWSLWISSIVLGYSFIITSILTMFFGGQDLSTVGALASKVDKSSPGLSTVFRVGGAVFMLVFFSFHFLFFHFVHSVFLNQFFPLVRADVFDTMEAGYFINLIATCIRRYWPFIVMSAISQLGKYIHAFQQIDSSLFSMPYKNVVRMHLSIFVFAFLHMTGAASFALYFVLIFYFFPLRSLWDFLKGTPKQPERSSV